MPQTLSSKAILPLRSESSFNSMLCNRGDKKQTDRMRYTASIKQHLCEYYSLISSFCNLMWKMHRVWTSSFLRDYPDIPLSHPPVF
jgi:hypothetical protein